MPVVFVHGVNNRPGPSWDEGVLARRSLFRRFMLPSLVNDPAKVTFHDPMWGPLGANFRWDQAALPPYDGSAEALGPEDRDALEIAASSGVDLDSVHGDALLQTARLTLVLAVDIAWAASARTLANEADADAWAELGRRAMPTPWRTRIPPGCSRSPTTRSSIRRLQAEVEAASAASGPARGPAGRGAGEIEALGISEVWDKILEGANRLGNAIEGVGTHVVLGAVREGLQRDLGLGMGDILVYMAKRGTKDDPGPIVAEGRRGDRRRPKRRFRG